MSDVRRSANVREERWPSRSLADQLDYNIEGFPGTKAALDSMLVLPFNQRYGEERPTTWSLRSEGRQPAKGRPMSPETWLRLGIVGTGNIGKAYAKAVAPIPDLLTAVNNSNDDERHALGSPRGP